MVSTKGMRYKRRGVDTDGHVANYVETEQLIHVHSHTLSFVQTRGSVPVFWSQAGYRYNPRPRIEKGMPYLCNRFFSTNQFSASVYRKANSLLNSLCYCITVISICYYITAVFDIAGEKETMPYFSSHFEQQLEIYKKLVWCAWNIVNI